MYKRQEYIIIEDTAGIAGIFLSKAAACFQKLGYDTMLIRSPLSPDKRLEQVIIPQLKLGFIAAGHLYSPEIDDKKIIKTISSKSYIAVSYTHLDVYKRQTESSLFILLRTALRIR